ncbi:hypothetical protein SSYRP_v1c00460 [Spiroplasma syrphidicola EA-1]|uniref:Uncharacterized protein n=1 Tax=Spiroplasma syrphidicola EA-1 TaxID=1276229 RepID=R4U2R0_9MOLU|nr:hypothetical protein [Spiroplasma syrphidicola]AGM25642.1 hypothetical protein SSYRP_v1c00460 [Spiroplasma syrphidicola EA-1]
MADFDPKCFKCINEQTKKGTMGGANSVLFGKMQQALVDSVDSEIYVCPRHR